MLLKKIFIYSKKIHYLFFLIYLNKRMFQIWKKGVISQKRYELLAHTKFIHNIILFDAGNPY